MTDINDPEVAEQLAHEAPDEHLKRGDFLARTAAGAGLAAGLATTLSPATIVAEAARVQRREHLPSPRNMPVDTFVVLMMENRSFDHYLGWLPMPTVARQASPTSTSRARPGRRAGWHPTGRAAAIPTRTTRGTADAGS